MDSRHIQSINRDLSLMRPGLSRAYRVDIYRSYQPLAGTNHLTKIPRQLVDLMSPTINNLGFDTYGRLYIETCSASGLTEVLDWIKACGTAGQVLPWVNQNPPLTYYQLALVYLAAEYLAVDVLLDILRPHLKSYTQTAVPWDCIRDLCSYLVSPHKVLIWAMQSVALAMLQGRCREESSYFERCKRPEYHHLKAALKHLCDKFEADMKAKGQQVLGSMRTDGSMSFWEEKCLQYGVN